MNGKIVQRHLPHSIQNLYIVVIALMGFLIKKNDSNESSWKYSIAMYAIKWIKWWNDVLSVELILECVFQRQLYANSFANIHIFVNSFFLAITFSKGLSWWWRRYRCRVRNDVYTVHSETRNERYLLLVYRNKYNQAPSLSV